MSYGRFVAGYSGPQWEKVVNCSTQSNIPHNKDDCEESVDTVGKHFTTSSAMFGFVDTVK